MIIHLKKEFCCDVFKLSHPSNHMHCTDKKIKGQFFNHRVIDIYQ